jgi:hypothetical protein
MALSRFVLPYADVGAGIRPSSGAKLFFYATGTSTFKSTFTDATGSTANTNPVIANANGVFPAIFFNGSFNVSLKDSNDVQIWTADPVISNALGYIYETTLDLISSEQAASANDIVESQGYTTKGDGGGAQWRQNGVTGQTVSQSPAQLGNALLNDGLGNQWAKVFKNSYLANNNTFSLYYTPANDTRIEERIFFGSASKDASGTTDKTESSTFISGNDFGSYYLERAAQNLSISKRGGIGSVNGAKGSERYTTLGYTIWVTLTVYSVGDKAGYGGRLYTVTVAGTTSGTAPSHTSGTAVDGTVTWQFDDYTYNVAIGEAACALADINDGTGVWARYTEIVRSAAGGTSFAEEVVSKNKGADVINNPYNRFPAGSTIGHMFAGGGDPSLGAATAPSTCGILFIKNGETWNKGIVFDKESIQGADGATGYGSAISLAKGHLINWFTVEGLEGSAITSDVTLNSRRGSITFENFKVTYRAAGSDVFSASRLNDTSTGSILAESYGGNARLSAEGTTTDVDLLIAAKGAGLVRFGAHAALSGETVTGYITIKDTAGTVRKLAVVS